MSDHDIEHNEPVGSVWARLREQHEEIASERDPLYLDDPVHDGVVFRYRYVPLQETKGATKRLRKIKDATDQTLASSIETLLLTLDEVMIMAPSGEIPTGRHGQPLYPQPLKPLAESGEPPIRFDERLCAGMGFPPKTANEAKRIVRRMFVNDYLIIAHAQEVSEWLASTGTEVSEDFAGELGKG